MRAFLWSACFRLPEWFFGLFLGAVLLIWNPMGWSILRVVWVLHLLAGIALASVLGMLFFRWGSARCFPPVSRRERKDEAVSAGSPPMYAIHVHTLAGAIFVGLVLTMPRRLWSKPPHSLHALGPLVHFLWRWGFPALGIEVMSLGIIFLGMGYRNSEDTMSVRLEASRGSPMYHQQKTQYRSHPHQYALKNTQTMHQTERARHRLLQGAHRFRPIHDRRPWHHVQTYRSASQDQDYGSYRPQETTNNPGDYSNEADSRQAHPQAMPNLANGFLYPHLTHSRDDAHSPSTTAKNPRSRSDAPVFHRIMPPCQKEAMSSFMKDAYSHIQAIQYDKTYDHIWITSRTLIRLSLIVLLSMGLAHIGIVLWLRT